MFAVFQFAANAVLPIVLIILLGFFLRRIGFLSERFLAEANRLMFKAALPAMLFYNIYNIESLADINWHTVLFGAAGVLLLFGIGLAYVLLFVKDRRQKGVVLQAAFRSNSAIIGYQLASALGGTAGLACISVLSAFTISLFNLLAVIALTLFTGSGKPDWKKIIKNIFTNPLILAIAAGLFVLLVRYFVPVNEAGEKVFLVKNALPFLHTAVGEFAAVASPLAFLVLGGQFSFKAVRGLLPQIAGGTALRLLVAPALLLTLAVLLDKTTFFTFNAGEYAAFIALFGSPVAVSSAVMAKEMDNDEQLAGQLVVWSSILSIFTIFGTVVLLRATGLL